MISENNLLHVQLIGFQVRQLLVRPFGFILPSIMQQILVSAWFSSFTVHLQIDWGAMDDGAADTIDFGDIVSKTIYCRVAEGQGLQKTDRPPGRDETRSVNPLVRTQVD